ncbi:MAG: (2Fe-2S)-binding protein [Myxococcota bacterium]
MSLCIVRAIRDGDLTSPEQLGEALGAGTSCGSCLPELRALLEAHRGAA